MPCKRFLKNRRIRIRIQAKSRCIVIYLLYRLPYLFRRRIWIFICIKLYDSLFLRLFSRSVRCHFSYLFRKFPVHIFLFPNQCFSAQTVLCRKLPKSRQTSYYHIVIYTISYPYIARTPETFSRHKEQMLFFCLC